MLDVPLDEHLQQVDVLAVERLEVDHLGVDPLLVQVDDVRRAAGHAGREVAADRAEHDHLPPVMYSQPWSPTPSTTAVAPELRTANRSPTRPRTKTSPPVAP